jgi:cell division septum initiation protein DivIVA
VKITPHKLKLLGACSSQVALFKELGGDTKNITLTFCLKHADKLEWDWAARHFLSPTARAEYDRVEALAAAEYDRVKDPAWAKYKRVRALAWAEYNRVEALAWTEYNRVKAPALAEYNRVKAPALAEYDRVKAPVLAEYNRVKAKTFWTMFQAENQCKIGSAVDPATLTPVAEIEEKLHEIHGARKPA